MTPLRPHGEKLQKLDLHRFNQQITDLFGKHARIESLLPDFLYLTVSLVNGGAASFESIRDGQLVTDRNLISTQAASWCPDLPAALRQASGQAVDAGRLVVQVLPAQPQISLISVPLLVADQPAAQAFTVALAIDGQPPEVFLLILQFLAGCYGLWRQKQLGMGAPQQTDRVGSTLSSDLVQILLSEDERDLACEQLLDQIKIFFGAQASALVRLNDGSATDRIYFSEASDLRQNSSLARSLRQIAEECGLHGRPLAHAIHAGDDQLLPSLIMRELAAELQAAGGILCIPVKDQAEQVVAALILTWQTSAPQVMQLLAEFRQCEPLVAGLLQKNRPLSLMAPLAQLRQRLRQGRRGGVATVVGLILVGLVLAMPVNFLVRGESVLEPRDVRFVTAQFDATLKEVYVRPGTTVAKGMVLALLDEREIELEISSLLAEIHKARKLEDIHLVSGSTALAQMAALERESLERKLQLQQDRLSQLSIISPVAGIVIQGDLERLSGSPVGKGQQLFEIAPLDRLVAQADIAETDIPYVNRGQQARLQLDAVPGADIDSQVDLLYPQAEIMDGKNVFLVEAPVANKDGQLRPGMRGSLVVVVGRKPLIFRLLRTPWLYLQKVLLSE